MPRRPEDERSAPRRRSPARTPEELENVLISKSLTLVEKQIDEGNVSPTVLAMYVKLGSSRGQLENERSRKENAMFQKKVETMEAAVDVKNLMEEALSAFKGYTGEAQTFDDDDDYYD